MKNTRITLVSVLCAFAFSAASPLFAQEFATAIPVGSIQNDERTSQGQIAKACIKKTKAILRDVVGDQKLYLKLQQLYENSKPAPKSSYLSAVLSMGSELDHEYGLDVAKIIALSDTIPDGNRKRNLISLLNTIKIERIENVRLMTSLERFISPMPVIYKD